MSGEGGEDSVDPVDVISSGAVPISVFEPIDEEAPSDALKKRLGFGFWVCVAWLSALVFVAIFAPLLPLEDPGRIRSGPAGEGPSWSHWFGTDKLGRDVFSRAVWGSRISLVVGAFAISFGILVGGAMGMVAGFLRGKIDQIVSFFFFVVLSYPALVLAILIVTSFERSLQTVALTLGILSVAPVGRLARAQTLVFAEREFVQAARVVGAKNGRIMTRELLPNVMIPMGALGLLGMGIAIVAEGGLAFLGLSVSGEGTGSLSWGRLINESRSVRDLQNMPHVAFSVILVMFLTILALNFAGDRIREYFDVRETAF
jgi:ABC-type dipeptide/oligopeptide/nickel transport system permease subunit